MIVLQRPLAMVLNQPESDSVAGGDIGFYCQRRQPSQRPLAMVLNQPESDSVADLLRWFLINLHQILLPMAISDSLADNDNLLQQPLAMVLNQSASDSVADNDSLPQQPLPSQILVNQYAANSLAEGDNLSPTAHNTS
jgi:hypothetical protein